MRILLDECFPKKLKGELPSHEVKMGWRGRKNRPLRTDLFKTKTTAMMSDTEHKHPSTSSADPEKEKAGSTSPQKDKQVDRKVDNAMEEAGTGRYTSREAADPELEAEQEESDKVAAERMGRGGSEDDR